MLSSAIIYSKIYLQKILIFADDEHKWVNSATSGDYESDFEKMWDAFWKMAWKKLNFVLEPCFDYGLTSFIIINILIYYCSQDKKCIHNAMKLSFIYLLYWMIRGALG